MKNLLKNTLIMAVMLTATAAATAQTGSGQRVQVASQPSTAQVEVIPSWVTTGVMPARDIPSTRQTPNYFLLSFVVPAPEPVKERRESLAADFAFEGKSTRLDASYGDNMTKLVEIERVIDALKKNRNVTITGIKIVGYTSIDGYVEENTALSQARAQELARYFGWCYGYPVSYFWRGEDWTRLAELVQQSDIVDKWQVINIINNTEDVNLRKVKLRQLSGGATYRAMQARLFPLLRRTVYTITYEVKKFDLEESRIALASEPQLLSLNELYTLAAAYPVGSRDFLAVFDVASRLFPTDITSKINNAALEIVNNANDLAINTLQHLSDPMAINNLGVAYARKGDMPRAASYFEQAARAGNPDAETNLKLARYWGF